MSARYPNESTYSDGRSMVEMRKSSKLDIITSQLSLIKKVHHKRDARRTTMMLIIVISVFLMAEIPLMVITVLHTLSIRFKILSNNYIQIYSIFLS